MATDTSWIPPALEPVALRLSRANQAAFELGKLAFEWSRNEPIELSQVETEAGTRDLVVVHVRPIPPAISMLFSEAIHHLRAAIDNTLFLTVSGMRSSLTEKAAKRIAMPIHGEASAFERWLKRNDQAGFPELGHQSLLATRLRALQPFEDSSSVPSLSAPIASLWGIEPVFEHPLRLIQGYSNEDKHRSIRTAVARTSFRSDNEAQLVLSPGMRPIERNDVIASAQRGERIELSAFPAVHIERPGGAAWVPPVRELDALYRHVANTVIPMLARGLALPRAFPAAIDLSDTGATARERIEAGTWETAHDLMRARSIRGAAEAAGIRQPSPRLCPATQASDRTPPVLRPANALLARRSRRSPPSGWHRVYRASPAAWLPQDDRRDRNAVGHDE